MDHAESYDVSEPDWGESAKDLMMVDEVSWDEAKAPGNRGVSLRRIRDVRAAQAYHYRWCLKTVWR